MRDIEPEERTEIKTFTAIVTNIVIKTPVPALSARALSPGSM